MNKSFGLFVIIASSLIACAQLPATVVAVPADGRTDINPPSDIVPEPTRTSALTVSFAGPPGGDIRRGQQDAPIFRFVLRANERVEVGDLEFLVLRIQGRLTGSRGTPYLRDLKIKDRETGQTVMSPVTLTGSTTENGYAVSFRDSFTMEAGETRDLLLTADLANGEDEPGEFVGSAFYVEAAGNWFLHGANVRRIADGRYVPADEINGNGRFYTNPFRVIDSGLSVTLAASPATHVTVKKARLEPSAGFVFTANPWSDLLVRSVTLTGQGNIFGTFRQGNLRDVVTSCVLFDGSTQVGLAQSPGYDGRMVISNMNVTIPAGTSTTLTARCTLDSVVAQEADAYSIGIASADDVVAEDSFTRTATINLASGVSANASATPVQYVVVRNSGTLTIELDPSTPRSINILAGNDDCWPLAVFRATTTLEGARISRIRVGSVGDASLYRSIAVYALDGAGNRAYRAGMDVLPAGVDMARDVELASPIDIIANSVARFELCAVTARLPFDTAGHLPIGLGIMSSNTEGEWDSSYVDTLNIRADGTVSGDRLLAPGFALFGNISLLF